MTTFDRFDPFSRRISEAMDDIAPARRPDYLDDVLQLTARTSQRPPWSFPERWLNVDTTFTRSTFGGRVPFRALLALAVIAALLAATVAYYVGTQKRVPAPYGPAGNGQLIFSMNGDLYVKGSLTTEPRLLLGGPGNQSGVILSPNGQLIAYDNYLAGPNGVAEADPHEWVAELDGSNPRQVLDIPYTFVGFEWAPDSKSIAVVTDPSGSPELWIAQADGSGAHQITVDGLRLWGATWDPIQPGVLLVRAEDTSTALVDLYYVDVNGKVLSRIEMGDRNLGGPRYEFTGLAFSPDGAKIAYNSIDAAEGPVGRHRVHVMNRDGSNDYAVPAPFNSNYSQAWSQFSPDGSSILMDSWRIENGAVLHQMAIAPADGSTTARRIGPVLTDADQIKMWSPDGTQIVQCACAAKELYSVDPVSGAFEKLPWHSDLPGWQRLAR